jgi:hypothetical protein
MRLYEIQRSLQKILEKLEIIDGKVSKLPHVQVKASNHLATTLIALKGLGKPATASQVSAITQKARAVESSYLNQLCSMGLVQKTRMGRKVLFSLSKEGLMLFE